VEFLSAKTLAQDMYIEDLEEALAKANGSMEELESLRFSPTNLQVSSLSIFVWSHP
jgi:hypothetical protein